MLSLSWFCRGFRGNRGNWKTKTQKKTFECQQGNAKSKVLLPWFPRKPGQIKELSRFTAKLPLWFTMSSWLVSAIFIQFAPVSAETRANQVYNFAAAYALKIENCRLNVLLALLFFLKKMQRFKSNAAAAAAPRIDCEQHCCSVLFQKNKNAEMRNQLLQLLPWEIVQRCSFSKKRKNSKSNQANLLL